MVDKNLALKLESINNGESIYQAASLAEIEATQSSSIKTEEPKEEITEQIITTTENKEVEQKTYQKPKETEQKANKKPETNDNIDIEITPEMVKDKLSECVDKFFSGTLTKEDIDFLEEAKKKGYIRLPMLYR